MITLILLITGVVLFIYTLIESSNIKGNIHLALSTPKKHIDNLYRLAGIAAITIIVSVILLLGKGIYLLFHLKLFGWII